MTARPTRGPRCAASRPEEPLGSGASPWSQEMSRPAQTCGSVWALAGWCLWGSETRNKTWTPAIAPARPATPAGAARSPSSRRSSGAAAPGLGSSGGFVPSAGRRCPRHLTRPLPQLERQQAVLSPAEQRRRWHSLAPGWRQAPRIVWPGSPPPARRSLGSPEGCATWQRLRPSLP